MTPEHPKPKGKYEPGTMKDYPELVQKRKEQEKNLGMEGAKTMEERRQYIRDLARAIFQKRIDARPLPGGRIGGGETAMNPIPEWERIFDEWRDFPKSELEQIIKEEFQKVHLEGIYETEGTSQTSDSEEAA